MKNFILDVDGVLTDGSFFYSDEGKVLKKFSADDNDALKILSNFIDIHFVTGDKNGFNISKRRIVDDMGFNLTLVSTINRISWIKNNFNIDDTIYMGDGIFDYLVMAECGYSIAPSNAFQTTISAASHVTKRKGGDRAVAEASIHILSHYFDIDIETFIKSSDKFQASGGWSL